MDEERFAAVCKQVANAPQTRASIGTLGEKKLHAALKLYYEPNTAFHEVPLAGYVADILRPEGVVEIQTGNFNRLREKLALFLQCWPVTIVYPVPYIRYLHWINQETGEVTEPRRSPRKGCPYDSIPELYKIKAFLPNQNLTICLALVELDEYKWLNGYGKQRKIRAHRAERVPRALHHEVWLGGFDYGYDALLPSGLPAQFTTADYKKAAKVPAHTASTAITVLHHVGAIRRTGKLGRAYLYEVAGT